MGDVMGIVQHLDDIRKVGVQTVWPTPLIAGHKDSFDLFDVVDHKAVHPQLGTIDDVKLLISTVHDRGNLIQYFISTKQECTW